MSLVNVHNEWDPLEEMIVGIADGAQVPEIFRNWEVIWCPEMVDTGYCWSYPRASIWQGMNFIMVNPSR